GGEATAQIQAHAASGAQTVEAAAGVRRGIELVFKGNPDVVETEPAGKRRPAGAVVSQSVTGDVPAGALHVSSQGLARGRRVFLEEFDVNPVHGSITADPERERVIPHRPGSTPVEVHADSPVGGLRADVVIRCLVDVEPLGGAAPEIGTEVQSPSSKRDV